MARVTRAVLACAEVVQAYVPGKGAGWLVRFVSADVDRGRFVDLERELYQALTVGGAQVGEGWEGGLWWAYFGGGGGGGEGGGAEGGQKGG